MKKVGGIRRRHSATVHHRVESAFTIAGIRTGVDGRRYRNWRYKYQWLRRERLLSVGPYPEISLKLARERREELRRQVAEGIDPSSRRKAEKLATADTFKAVAEEWIDAQARRLAPETVARIRDRKKSWAYPEFGREPVRKLDAMTVLRALKQS